MRNVQKVLIGIFLSGVLLGGVGTGIAVAEFSSLSYGGRKTVGAENLVTKEMDFEIPTDGRTVILGYRGYHGGWEGNLVEDSSVPVGIVRYEVTYNERLIEPFLYYEEYEEEEMEEPDQDLEELPEEDIDQETERTAETGDENLLRVGELSETEEIQEEEIQTDKEEKEPVYAGELYLSTRYKGNDFELFMENKDRILEELKQKKLSSYEIVYLTEITVKVNPETRPYVKDLFLRIK